MLKDCHSTAEIMATYRAARERLYNPPSIRIIAVPPPPKGPPASRPPRPPVDHDPDVPPLAVDDIHMIIRVVAGFFRVKVVAMTSPSREGVLIEPRFWAIHLSRVMTRASTTQIGRAFQRDHTTIMHALRKVHDKLATDPMAVRTVRRLRERVVRFHQQQQERMFGNDKHGSS